MSILVGGLVDRVFNEWLIGTYAADYNELAQAASANDTTLTFKYPPTGPAPGALISIYDELCYVVDVVPQDRQVLVIRGVHGTTREPHGVGSVAEANPRYWRALVRDAAFRELESWPKELYRTEAYRTTIGAGAFSFQVRHSSQLPVRRVLKVRRGARNAIDPRHFSCSFSDALDVTADGDAWIYLDSPQPRDLPVTVHLATEWDLGPFPWDDLADLGLVGLTNSQIDCLVIGTVWRLVAGKEVRRLQMEAQGQSRAPQEVPTGANLQAGLRLKLLRDDRIFGEDGEIAKLKHREGHL